MSWSRSSSCGGNMASRPQGWRILGFLWFINSRCLIAMFCGFMYVLLDVFTLNLGGCWLQNAQSRNDKFFTLPVFLCWLRQKIHSFSHSDDILDIGLFLSLRNCLYFNVYYYYFAINILLMGPSIILHIYGHAYFRGLSWSQDPFRIRTNGTKRVPRRKEMPDYGNERETQNFTTPLEKLRMQLCLCSSNTGGSMTKQRKQREKKTKR